MESCPKRKSIDDLAKNIEPGTSNEKRVSQREVLVFFKTYDEYLSLNESFNFHEMTSNHSIIVIPEIRSNHMETFENQHTRLASSVDRVSELRCQRYDNSSVRLFLRSNIRCKCEKTAIWTKVEPQNHPSLYPSKGPIWRILAAIFQILQDQVVSISENLHFPFQTFQLEAGEMEKQTPLWVSSFVVIGVISAAALATQVSAIGVSMVMVYPS